MMTTAGLDGSTSAAAGSSWRTRVGRWAFWELTPVARCVVLVVIVGAYAMLAVSWFREPLDLAQLATGGLLVGMGMVHTEIALGVERTRASTTAGSHTDMTAIWSFAAILLLSPALAVTANALISGHIAWRLTRSIGWRPYRQVYTNAVLVLSAFAASAATASARLPTPELLSSPTTFLTIICGIAAYVVVEVALFTLARGVASGQWSWSYGDNTVEVASLSLGACLAVVFTSDHPFAALFFVPGLLLLHRTIAANQLEQQAGLDDLTGLRNSAAWHQRARRELRRASRRQHPLGLLLVDVNDAARSASHHPHTDAASDRGPNWVVTAVATAVSYGARPHDVLGYLGGNVFAVLLPGVDDDLRRVADRIEAEVARLRPAGDSGDRWQVHAAIGAAMRPADGRALDELLDSARASIGASRRREVVTPLRPAQARDVYDLQTRTDVPDDGPSRQE